MKQPCLFCVVVISYIFLYNVYIISLFPVIAAVKDRKHYTMAHCGKGVTDHGKRRRFTQRRRTFRRKIFWRALRRIRRQQRSGRFRIRRSRIWRSTSGRPTFPRSAQKMGRTCISLGFTRLGRVRKKRRSRMLFSHNPAYCFYRAL